MKHLLIGGAGFIGTNFADKLLEDKNSVIIADNLSRKGTDINLDYLNRKYGESLEFIRLDIRRDTDRLNALMEDVDVVYHLAGQVAVTTSVNNPRDDFEANALGTFNILEAIRLSERKPMLLYASTNKVYGGLEDIPVAEQRTRYVFEKLKEGIAESRALDFHSPYGCSKGTGDQYVRDYARIFGLKTAVLRQSCIYGPHQFGIEDQGWVAWFTIASILDRQITIYGNGKQVRDILFIDDLFQCFYKIVSNMDQLKGNIFNIGGGIIHTLSLLELLDKLETLLDKKIEYRFHEPRPGDQPIYISDIRKAEQLINWSPQVAVDEGLEKMVEWVKTNKENLLKII